MSDLVLQVKRLIKEISEYPIIIQSLENDSFSFGESILLIGNEVYEPLSEMVGIDNLSSKYTKDDIELLVHTSWIDKDDVFIRDKYIENNNEQFNFANDMVLYCMTTILDDSIRAIFISDELSNFILLYIHDEVLKV